METFRNILLNKSGSLKDNYMDCFEIEGTEVRITHLGFNSLLLWREQKQANNRVHHSSQSYYQGDIENV